MDRRFSLILGLGVAVLGGTAGCTPSFLSRPTGTPPPVQSQKPPAPPPNATAQTPARVKEKELPKRQPSAQCCVAFGDFSFRESLAAGRPPQDQKQRRDTAKRAYQQALQLDPNCIEAHRGLARVYAADEDYERAVSAYESALRASPKDANLWFELGMGYSRRKEWERAIDALAHAAELNPEERQYANMLGFCLARAGRFEESLVLFTQVLGSEAKARYNIARMMIHLGQGAQGRQQLELSLKKEPNLGEARELLAQVDAGLAKQGQEIQPVDYREPQR